MKEERKAETEERFGKCGRGIGKETKEIEGVKMGGRENRAR